MSLTRRPTTPVPDDAAFAAVFNRLAVALREPQDDSGVTIQVYFEALRDVPLAALQDAATALMREPGRRFFPTTAEWREAAALAHRHLLEAAVFQPRGEPWHHECPSCEDTGWVQGLTCPGDRTCGRPRPHAAHDYVTACPCRPTNRTYLRKHHLGGGA